VVAFICNREEAFIQFTYPTSRATAAQGNA
jgi:hypothetical protein